MISGVVRVYLIFVGAIPPDTAYTIGNFPAGLGASAWWATITSSYYGSTGAPAGVPVLAGVTSVYAPAVGAQTFGYAGDGPGVVDIVNNVILGAYCACLAARAAPWLPPPLARRAAARARCLRPPAP